MSMIVRATCLTLLFAAAAQSATVGGIALPERRGDLRLHGAGLLRKGLVFKIYVGALYVAETNHVAAILGNVPKRIDIHYFHHTPKKYMVRAANDTLRKNIPAETIDRLTPQIDQLHAAFLDGEKGAVASLVHRPGIGLDYYFNGEPVVTIPGDDFANAYFTVWLGEPPSSRTVKEAMVKGMP